MKKLVVENNFIINLIIISSFIVHLASINFFPTNFEGGYGAYANFFHSDNKLIYLKSYYFAQFNTYLFSLIASFLNFLIPFLDGYQIVKILSASSYFFLGFGEFLGMFCLNFVMCVNVFISILEALCAGHVIGYIAHAPAFEFVGGT